MSTTITSNPPSEIDGNYGVRNFFGFLAGAIGAVGSAKLGNYLDEEKARSTAKVQAMMNANHQVNPSTGANDPRDAQKAADKSFLERFLPTSMLYSTDSTTGARTPKLAYYVVLGALVLVLFLALRRLMRK